VAEARTPEKATVIELEVERGRLVGDWKVGEDYAASGGEFVEAGVTHREGPLPKERKRLVVSLPFRIALPGQHTIHYRSFGTSGAYDSQFLRVRVSLPVQRRVVTRLPIRAYDIVLAGGRQKEACRTWHLTPRIGRLQSRFAIMVHGDSPLETKARCSIDRTWTR
jgi:hypothetical protein